MKDKNPRTLHKELLVVVLIGLVYAAIFFWSWLNRPNKRFESNAPGGVVIQEDMTGEQ